MDKITAWLLRGASDVVIAVGITGIGITLRFLNKSNSDTKGIESNQNKSTERSNPYILKVRCPEKFKKGGWACYGYKTTGYLIHGAAIGYCAVENGSLLESEGWPSAIEYANNKLGGSNRVRKDLIRSYKSHRFSMDRSSNSVIKKAGGCSYLLK